MKGKGQPQGFRSLLPYITPHRSALLWVITLLIAGGLVSLANPWMAGLLTASILDENMAEIGPLLGVWMGLMILRSLLTFGNQYLIGSTGEQITARLRSHTYQHMQSLPVAYYHERKAGETLSLLSTDAEIISGFVTDTLVQSLPALLTFCGALVIMVWLDWSIAILAASILPAYIIAMKFVGRHLRPLSRRWVDANSQLLSLAQENIGMLAAIKAFIREGHEARRFHQANQRLLSISRRQWRIEAALSPLVSLMGGLGVLGLLWLGSSHIESGRLAAPDLVRLLFYAILMISPLSTLANVYGKIQTTRGAAERIIAFLAQEPEPADQGATVLTKVRGDILFDNVTFAYANGARVLHGLDLHISAGETVALTGPNGAGKSTLVYLLLRYEDPASGRILIDGIDSREATLASVRAQIGLVAQHVLLLNGSVAENIAYGEPGADLDDIERAARVAHAHDFIVRLPQGYSTIIGDQGVKLSGGQRQRLSLARTLLKDPPILVLDEATAMFDPAGESAFIDECHEVLTRKTVILITHRPASLALADRVLELANGRLSNLT